MTFVSRSLFTSTLFLFTLKMEVIEIDHFRITRFTIACRPSGLNNENDEKEEFKASMRKMN